MKQKYAIKSKRDLINIIGIDPGGNTGVCIFSVDEDFIIHDILPFTYYLDKMVDNDSKGDRRVSHRLVMLDLAMSELFAKYKPIVVSTETSFANRAFPKSGLTLSKYIGVLELAIKRYCGDIPVVRSSPKEVKSDFSKSGKSDKDGMTGAVMKNVELRPFFENFTIDEHCIDATAMAYNALTAIRNNPTLLLTARE